MVLWLSRLYSQLRESGESGGESATLARSLSRRLPGFGHVQHPQDYCWTLPCVSDLAFPAISMKSQVLFLLLQLH